ncbi:MAG: PAS domain-containing protein [Lachnospiraceae bacterium]|nr:PAS domain-containing protein [Lachnospiraceae bacterium]
MALTNSQVISVVYGTCRMDVEEGWKLIKVDDEFVQLTGYTKEKVIKDRVVYSQLVHEDDLADFFQRFTMQLETKGIAYLSHRLITRDGRETVVYCLGELFVDENTGRTLAKATLTPVRENERALQEAEQRAED